MLIEVFEQIDFFMENLKVFDARNLSSAKDLVLISSESRERLSSCLLRVEHDELPPAMHYVSDPNLAQVILVTSESVLEAMLSLKQDHVVLAV